MRRKRTKSAWLWLMLLPMALQAQHPLYTNVNAPTEERVHDLLQRLTTDEKIDLLRATSPGVERLGIDKYYHGNEALHGVVRPGRFTVFPQAIAMAATWNPELVQRVATAISDEARARWNELEQGRRQKAAFSDLLTFWSPTVNLARDPRWGRTPETYGEDPLLSGMMGTAFVRGLQGDDPRYLKVVSTPKHFACNNEEHNRFECDVPVSEKQLREYYLLPFERCIRQGKAASIMSAYNAINNLPCTANPWLLNKILREEWGFDGYVVSDCGAPGLLVYAHHYVKTKEAAAALCIKAGLDLECGDDVYDLPLRNAYRLGMVSDADIDSAAARVLRTRIRLGLLDGDVAHPYRQIAPSTVGCKAHRELALETARQSLVLLKNEDATLPIQPRKVRSIGIVGINAQSAEFGEYSGMPVATPISVAEGIARRAPRGMKVRCAEWVSAADGMQLIDKRHLQGGVRAEYYDNTGLQGTPRSRMEEWVNYEPGNQAPDPFLPKYNYSVRWTGQLCPTVSGIHTFGLTSDEGARLYIDGRCVIDAWGGHAVRTDTVALDLTAGKTYDLKVEYYETRDYSIARLRWRMPQTTVVQGLARYGEAEQVARQSDMVVAVMGINKTIEREGQDRNDITLPKDQQEFLKLLYEVNPNTVLVLVAGSPLAINWEQEHLPAIVNAWYGGESGGRAVAEMLFGDFCPSGRLPLTYYKDLSQLPPFDDYDITHGRTYQYAQAEPLYPFGYGLSYTNFAYGTPTAHEVADSVEVRFELRNCGAYDAHEVVQAYVTLPERPGPQPSRQLMAFARIATRKQASQEVRLRLAKRDLRYWDEEKETYVTCPKGTYHIYVGGNSTATQCCTITL